jgi:hypothetical protein
MREKPLPISIFRDGGAWAAYMRYVSRSAR